MCIIVDTCALASVFRSDAADHPDFEPVLRWISKGKGRMVYGGRTYAEELRKAARRLSILSDLERARRIIKISDSEVDSEEDRLRELVPDKDFDDPHIVAIVIVSGSMLVCTNDKRSHKYLKRSDLYPKGIDPPHIYSSGTHWHLLCDKNIPACYR